MAVQLQTGHDRVKEKYSLDREKYEEAFLIRLGFHEGLLTLGQQQLEMVKLHQSFILAKKEDLSKWDSVETIELFDSAEIKMKATTKMQEFLEELKDRTLASNVDEGLSYR